jgi:uncharacterized protein YceK
MKKVMILLSLCLLLSGCAMTGDTWYHPYGSQYFGEED